ncbi:MAG TPA: sugar transferase [Kouleothrix sp.]|uniref:sugar transferase n=1 Tax=Kouleothrix sp. TaxID=2779161 RepID=UPI002BC409E5|nr:sugar transferase [Kouleothrix sp.]
MQLLLLATGEEPKLEPLAHTIAPPLLPVVNRPVMAIMIELLARAGYKKLLISLHQNAGSIAAYFGTGRRWNMQIEYITQREAWGNAGALRWAAQLIHEPVLVLPADCILDLDVDAALAAHQAHGGPLTLMVQHDLSGSPAMPVNANTVGHVSGLGSTTPSLDTFTGAFICDPGLLHYIPARTHFDVYRQFLPAVLKAGELVHAYRTNGYYNPLSTFQLYHEAQRVFLYSAYRPEHLAQLPEIAALPTVRYPSIEGHQIAPGIWVGPNHLIHPSARLAPPLCIGEGSRIGYGAELGPEVVIGSSVVIDDEATVERSTILRRSYIGHLVHVRERVVSHSKIIDINTSDSIDVVDDFLLSGITAGVFPKNQLARLLDRAVAMLLLLVAIPIMLPIAVFIAIVSGGKVLARLPRIGQHGAIGDANEPQQFNLLAFRTQRDNGSWYPLGRLLHSLELDRLPELWNIVSGDITLVGVKPLSPAETDYLQEAWHQKRNEYPCGFTGLWYVQTTPHSTLDDMLIADAYYTATRSWRVDLAIVLRTPLVWLRRLRPEAQGYYGRIDKVNGV